MVATADFPQAGVLDQVGGVATAVSKGKSADAEIEEFIGLGSKGRQGRYYRLAAEILGLVTNSQNHAVLTSLGEEYATLSTRKARTDFLARCLVETPVFKEALKYIHNHKPNSEQLKLWFRNFYPGAAGTADRRYSTFINYLDDADLITQVGGMYQIKKYEGAVAKEKIVTAVGITGKPVVKDPASAPISTATGTIKFEVDAQKKERANQTHWHLVAAKSTFLYARGLPAFENQLVDLYSRKNEDIIIYEMKSASVGATNLPSQIRKAVAQLYEYRYVFQTPKPDFAS